MTGEGEGKEGTITRLETLATQANKELVQNAKGNESVPSVEKIYCTDLAAIF